VDAAQTLNMGWQIADLIRHFRATNEQVIAAICERVRQEREELRRLRRQKFKKEKHERIKKRAK